MKVAKLVRNFRYTLLLVVGVIGANMVASLPTLAATTPTTTTTSTYLYGGQIGNTQPALTGVTDVAVDAQGNMYVSMTYGVEKLSPTGQVLWTAGVANNTVGADPSGITIGSNGNVYVSDTSNNRIVVFNPSDGTTVTTWGTAGSGNGAFNSPRGITTDSQGNVYVADAGNGRVQKFDANGNFLLQFGSIGSNPGQFLSTPNGIAVKSDGTIWVANASGIDIFNASGTFQRHIALSNVNFPQSPYLEAAADGTMYYSTGQDGQQNAYVLHLDVNGNELQRIGGPISHADGQLYDARGMATVGSKLYVADTGSNRIEIFDTALKYQSKFGTYGTDPTLYSAAGQSAIDSNGNLYVIDTGRVQVYSSDGTYVRQFAVSAQVTTPFGIAVDPTTDQIYITDYTDARVAVYAANGNFVSYFAPSTQFYNATGIEIGPNGNVFVLSVSPATGQPQITELTTQGTIVRTIDVSAQIGRGRSYDLALDSDGNIYVSNTRPGVVYKYAPDGTFLQQIGAGVLGSVYGVTIGEDGKIFAADVSNNRFVVFNPDGSQAFTLGQLGSGNGEFYQPTYLTLGTDGSLFVSDSGNYRVQRFAPLGTYDQVVTSELSPALQGTVANPKATVRLQVNGAWYSGVNNGDGTWSLPAGQLQGLRTSTYPVNVEFTSEGTTSAVALASGLIINPATTPTDSTAAPTANTPASSSQVTAPNTGQHRVSLIGMLVAALAIVAVLVGAKFAIAARKKSFTKK
jgi:tripartite motif-containing protein 71